jgi:hypothetical protein
VPSEHLATGRYRIAADTAAAAEVHAVGELASS